MQDHASPPGTTLMLGQEEIFSEEELEEEADQLYEWTQDLNIDSLD